MPDILPNEPLILEAKQAFPEVQATLSAKAPVRLSAGLYQVGWVGTNILATRGCFAVVSIDNPALEDYVGEHLRVHYGARWVDVYCASRDVIPSPICLTRRAFLALALLSTEELTCIVEVIQ